MKHLYKTALFTCALYCTTLTCSEGSRKTFPDLDLFTYTEATSCKRLKTEHQTEQAPSQQPSFAQPSAPTSTNPDREIWNDRPALYMKLAELFNSRTQILAIVNQLTPRIDALSARIQELDDKSTGRP